MSSAGGGSSLAVLAVDHAHLSPGFIHDLHQQSRVCERHAGTLLQTCKTWENDNNNNWKIFNINFTLNT